MSAGTAISSIDEPGEPVAKQFGLKDITSGKVARPRRTMIYGVQGVGKSTFAANIEGVVFLPTEEGLNDIDCDKFPVAKSLSEVMDRLLSLYNEQHDYKVVCIDTLDWLESLIWKAVCEQNGWDSIDVPGWGKGYKAALPHWQKLLAALDTLRETKGMACCLLAHSTVIHYENPEAEGYDRHSPRLHKDASALIQEWADEVFFATYRVYTRPGEKKDSKGNATSFKGIGGEERILRCTEKPFAMAKNRLNMPDEIEMDYSIYKTYQEK